MTCAILTTGYQSRRPQDLLAWCRDHDAVVLDIRLRPFSQQPGWAGPDLAWQFGDRYRHCPQWGNKALGTGGIEIADFAAGWAVCDALRQSRRVVLLCRCAQIEVCHRGVLASMIREQHSVECGELEFWPKVKDTNLFTETI